MSVGPIIDADLRLALHLDIVEHAMDLAEVLRQYPTENEDMKVVQVLGMRLFNAFAASVKLALSGYGQNSARKFACVPVYACPLLTDR